MIDWFIIVASLCNKRVIEESVFYIVRTLTLFVVTIIVKVFANKIQFYFTASNVFQGVRTIVFGGMQMFFITHCLYTPLFRTMKNICTTFLVVIFYLLIFFKNTYFRNKRLQNVLRRTGVLFTVGIDCLTFSKFIYLILRILLLNYRIFKLLRNSLKSFWLW